MNYLRRGRSLTNYRIARIDFIFARGQNIADRLPLSRKYRFIVEG